MSGFELRRIVGGASNVGTGIISKSLFDAGGGGGRGGGRGGGASNVGTGAASDHGGSVVPGAATPAFDAVANECPDVGDARHDGDPVGGGGGGGAGWPAGASIWEKRISVVSA